MEVGAGVGAHSLLLARTIGTEGHLFLYEARPMLQRVLRQNLSANRLGNVTVMRRRLGPASAVLGAQSGQHSVAGGSPEAVPTETLDELYLERLEWIKINADVSALDVIGGAAESLWRLRPQLLAAVPDAPSLAALASQLRDFGYRCWRLETPLFNRDNFYGRDTDIFSGRTVLSVLAMPEENVFGLALEGCIEL